MNKEKIMEAVTMLIEAIGEDPQREGLVDTPDRIARMYEEIFAGIGQTAEEHLILSLNGTFLSIPCVNTIFCLSTERCTSPMYQMVKLPASQSW